MEKDVFRSGVVAVIGRPNVGKSSLMNSLLEYKLSIVTAKPQTTRDNILGVWNGHNCQILFVDTPGIHKPVHRLGLRLVERALSMLDEADLILYVVTINDLPTEPENDRIICLLKETKTPVLLAVNKVDLPGSKSKILAVISAFQKVLPLVEVLPVSAKEGINREKLLELVGSRLPDAPPMYPQEIITDRTERFIAQEIIREKLMEFTEQEVPHSVAVEVEEYKSPDEYPQRKDLFIRATIYVEREGQKAIVLGKRGEKIKALGAAARQTLEELTGFKVFLDLWVKINKGWRDSERELKKLGYGE